jgi:hypothetical protein
MTGYEPVAWLVEPGKVAIDLLPVRLLEGCYGLRGQAVSLKPTGGSPQDFPYTAELID